MPRIGGKARYSSVHQNLSAERNVDPFLLGGSGGDFVVVLANTVTIGLEGQAWHRRSSGTVKRLRVVQNTIRRHRPGNRATSNGARVAG